MTENKPVTHRDLTIVQLYRAANFFDALIDRRSELRRWLIEYPAYLRRCENGKRKKRKSKRRW